jgi:hypothetical protein
MRQAHRSLREVQELWMGVFGGVLSGTGAIETLWLVNVSGHGGEVVGTFVEMQMLSPDLVPILSRYSEHSSPASSMRRSP